MTAIFGRGLAILGAAALLTGMVVNTKAARIIETGNGLSVKVNPDSGSYEIRQDKPAWKFGGSLGTRMENVVRSPGSDDLGNYAQISFAWQADGVLMSGWIRVYITQPLVLFSQTIGAASEKPPAPFPSFTKLPQSLHVFSYGATNFAPPHFSAQDTATPWLVFDDRARAAIISPASHFMVSSMHGDGRGEIASGFSANLRNLPAGFTQQTLMAFGNGINRTWDFWGRAFLSLERARRPAQDADVVSKYLGYWTDNGAYYYYNYDMDKGYAGTLQALVDRYRQEQIPIRYLQLDSWWYPKTTTGPDGTPGADKKSDKLPAGDWNRYGGLLEYRADASLFPNGLDHFQKAIGLPLVTHNRWVDPASPYHEHYRISGIAAVDPNWWRNIAEYMKSSGIITYEQDWLDRIYNYSPAFSSDPETAEAFLDDMSGACRRDRINMQYCMPLPCYFLQGSRYENLTTIRASGDRFETNKWNNFLYTSRLARSLAISPWTDVYMSGELDNLLLSTLSSGPVGIGDAMGKENKENLLQAVRADGVIVKPDEPIVPLDQTYLADANKQPAPLIAETYTDHGGIRTAYIFAFNRPKKPGSDVRLTPAQLGINSPVYVYDYFSGQGRRLRKNDIFSAQLGERASAYYVVAPSGQSGIAFLGDKDKFVGTSRERVTTMNDQPGRLTVGIELAASETLITLHGYSEKPPRVTVLAGEDDPLKYDPISHYFQVEVHADTHSPLDHSGADPVRRLTVALETKPAE